MIQVVDQIIEIERSSNLYKLIDDRGVPVWDILRYDVIKTIEYRYNPNKDLLPKSSRSHRLMILINAVLSLLRILPIGKRKFFFYAHSRNKDSQGQLYDRIANDLIIRAHKRERVIFDAATERVGSYKTYSLPIGFFYAINRNIALEKKIGDTIVKALNNGFKDSVITYSQLQRVYSQFFAQVRMFDWILKKTKPEKVIISYGRFKPLCFAAKKNGIPTWLMQHSLIEKDDATIAGSCPDKQYGINADVLLTFGSYWGEYLKHLMDIQVIGNQVLSKEGVKVSYDGTIVIASSLYQGPYLSNFFKEYAQKHPEKSFIYKLHPGERIYLQRYRDLFENCANVQVVLDEQSMDDLLISCSLMVLVSSTTFYEALNLKKCVAVYAIPEFESLTRFLLKIPNSYSFTTEKEFDEIVNNANFDNSLAITFFEPFNKAFADHLVS